MTEPPTDDRDESGNEEIQTEIITDVSYEGEGTVYAVQIVKDGDRRVDWKIGHVDGTFAEGTDYYYKGELFDSDDLQKMPENATSGRFRDGTFHELLDLDISIDDDKLTETRVYDRDGEDAVEWAIGYLDGKMLPETILEEWWEHTKSLYDEGELE